MRYDRFVRRHSDLFFAAVLAGAMLFVYWHLLGQPLLLDDVGLFHFLWLGRAVDAGHSVALILGRCALPVYFRPLAAPVFWILYRLWGAAPLGYRLIMLAAAWASSLLVGKIAARLGGGPVAGRAAALLYAFSWVQWSGLTLVAGLAQSLSDVFFWTGLLVFLRDEDAGLAPGLALAAAALLFKEHAIVWPLFALAAAGSGGSRKRLAFAGAALAAGYLVLRLAAPGLDFAAYTYIPRWDPAAVFQGTSAVLRALLESWTARPSRMGAIRETLAALALGAAAAATLLMPKSAASRSTPARAARFALLGLGAGFLPYLAFPDALDADSISRFSLAWGAAAVGLGTLLEIALERSRARTPNLAAAIWIAAASLLFLKTAALFRRPDAARRVFMRWPLLAEARWLEGALAPAASAAAAGDVFVFTGFRAADRAPWRFQLQAPRRVDAFGEEAPAGLAPGAWTVALLRNDAGQECLDVHPPSGSGWTNCREAL